MTVEPIQLVISVVLSLEFHTLWPGRFQTAKDEEKYLVVPQQLNNLRV